MILTKTPLRVSFLGGGTDFPTFFKSDTGYVLGTAINKYVYVNILALPKFAEERYRFTYRVTESVLEYSDFKHPVVREVLKDRNWNQPLNIATMADLPGRSGLGSSSSFTVGFINALNRFDNLHTNPDDLAKESIRIEREILGEPGGWQDQYQASFGGLSLYKFDSDLVTPNAMVFEKDLINYISESLVLVPMHDWRDSGGFAEVTKEIVSEGVGHQLALELANLTLETSLKLNSNFSLKVKFEYLCSAVNSAWDIKVKLSQGTLNKQVLEKIDEGLTRGARAGRLCGAGGSGFILFLIPPQNRALFVEKMSADLAFPVSVEERGSQILETTLSGRQRLHHGSGS